MLATMYAALVTCSIVLENDDTYYAVCEGRKDLMYSVVQEKVQMDKLGGYCIPYRDEEIGDTVSFVVVCE